MKGAERNYFLGDWNLVCCVESNFRPHYAAIWYQIQRAAGVRESASWYSALQQKSFIKFIFEAANRTLTWCEIQLNWTSSAPALACHGFSVITHCDLAGPSLEMLAISLSRKILCFQALRASHPQPNESSRGSEMRQNPVLNRVRTGKSMSCLSHRRGVQFAEKYFAMGLGLSGRNSYFHFEYLNYGYTLNFCVWDVFLKAQRVCQGREINCVDTTYHGEVFFTTCFLYQSCKHAKPPWHWEGLCSSPSPMGFGLSPLPSQIGDVRIGLVSRAPRQPELCLTRLPSSFLLLLEQACAGLR